MKKLLLVGVVLTGLICLASCTTTRSTKAVCWQNALFAAVVVEDNLNLPTRIVYSCNKQIHSCHTQAQTKIDGIWYWMSPDFRYINIDDIPDRVWSLEGKWTKFKYYTVEEALEMWGN